MAAASLSFLLGVITLLGLPSLPEPRWLLALLLLLPLLIWQRQRRVVHLIGWLLLGLLWGWWRATLLLADPLPTALEGVDLQLDAEVIGLLPPDQRPQRLLLRPLALYHHDQALPSPGLLRVNSYQPVALQPGERWRLTVRLWQPRGLLNAGGFDYEKWLRQQRIGATGYLRATPPPQRLAAAAAWSLPQLRQQLANRLAATTDDPTIGALLQALVVGDRQALPAAAWEILNATGTSHLLAISGLHIGMVAGFVALLSGGIWRRCQRCTLAIATPRAVVLPALLAATGYALLAGGSLPTQRALLMLLVLSLAIWRQRPLATTDALALALFAVLIWDPLAPLAVSFWLSFGAVAIILYGMQQRLRPRGWWWRYGRLQWLLTLAMLPLLVLLFGRISLSAPLINLLAIPWLGGVLALLLPALLLLPLLPQLALPLLTLAAQLLAWLWQGLTLAAAALPAQPLPHPSPLLVGLALIGVGWLLAPRGWPLRWLGAIPLLVLLIGVAPAPLPSGAVAVTMLDVGQGLAVVVRSRHHQLLYDTGPRFSDRFDAGAAVVVPWLQQQGITHLDRVIVSHSDGDHAGGMAAVAAALPIDQLLAGEPQRIDAGAAAALQQTPITHCYRGQQWHWDGIDFRMVWPPAEAILAHDNDRSCVLLVSGGGHQLLLTGDISAAAEAQLLALEPTLRADLLFAPHHGSRTSSSGALLQQLAARWVLISNGHRRRQYFPHPSVLARYRAHAITPLESARDGAITLQWGGVDGDLIIRRGRQQLQRWWHWQPTW